MAQAFLITGRTLHNWRERGQTPPDDLVRLRCLNCREPLTISQEGWKRVVEAERARLERARIRA